MVYKSIYYNLKKDNSRSRILSYVTVGLTIMQWTQRTQRLGMTTCGLLKVLSDVRMGPVKSNQPSRRDDRLNYYVRIMMEPDGVRNEDLRYNLFIYYKEPTTTWHL